MLGHACRASPQSWPKLSRVLPKWAKFGPRLTKLGRCFTRCGPNPTSERPISRSSTLHAAEMPKHGRISSPVGPNAAKAFNMLTSVARLPPKLGNIGRNQSRPKSGCLLPTLEELPRIRARFCPCRPHSNMRKLLRQSGHETKENEIPESLWEYLICVYQDKASEQTRTPAPAPSAQLASKAPQRARLLRRGADARRPLNFNQTPKETRQRATQRAAWPAPVYATSARSPRGGPASVRHRGRSAATTATQACPQRKERASHKAACEASQNPRQSARRPSPAQRGVDKVRDVHPASSAHCAMLFASCVAQCETHEPPPTEQGTEHATHPPWDATPVDVSAASLAKHATEGKPDSAVHCHHPWPRTQRHRAQTSGASESI